MYYIYIKQLDPCETTKDEMELVENIYGPINWSMGNRNW